MLSFQISKNIHKVGFLNSSNPLGLGKKCLGYIIGNRTQEKRNLSFSPEALALS
jgi:hypothetical protein